MTVSDDGIGIAPDQRKKIFRRLCQARPERSGDGAGPGLVMARQIARLHGGELTSRERRTRAAPSPPASPMQ